MAFHILQCRNYCFQTCTARQGCSHSWNLQSSRTYTVPQRDRYALYIYATDGECTELYSGKEIVQNIEKGEWTASKVVEAYIARAAYAHAKTNCLTESMSRVSSDLRTRRASRSPVVTFKVLFAQARQEAEQLDKLFSTTGKLKGPLHGVPVSLKDQCRFPCYPARFKH